MTYTEKLKHCELDLIYIDFSTGPNFYKEWTFPE